jgi:hypothetical protein
VGEVLAGGPTYDHLRAQAPYVLHRLLYSREVHEEDRVGQVGPVALERSFPIVVGAHDLEARSRETQRKSAASGEEVCGPHLPLAYPKPW